ncbi:MAG TPA: BamA/TamA family outer membrane protein, partial [Gemmatimonadaceae bacterium]|nr:BamA/TamA family outer membrane protein [Gemmatimonadaceae bacterium]
MRGREDRVGREIAARRPFARLAAAVVVAALALAAPPRAARAQETNCDPGDVEVRGLHFKGNRHFSDAELGNAVVTTPSSWERRFFKVLGERRCVDRASELPRDLLRLVIFYRNRGYAQATVDTTVRTAANGIDVTFRVNEGRPILIDSLTILGLDSVAERRAIERNLAVRVGQPFDKGAIEAARDSIERRLKNAGYPDPQVTRQWSSNTADYTASVVYEAIPGPRAHIGRIGVTVEPRRGAKREISERAVRGVLGVRPGDLYRYGELTTAQRNLYQTDAFEHVDIRQVVDSGRLARDSAVDLLVSLSEGYMHELRPGIGYGTLDCFRAQADYVDRNFLGGSTGAGVRRLELSGRVSKIGVGPQFGGFQRLCTPEARSDPFSDKVNYYVGATLRQPVLFGLRSVPTVTLFSEVRSEFNAYRRTTPIGGIASLAVRRRVPMTLAYELSLRRTTAQPALFCAVFNVCDEQTRSSLEQLKRLAVASVAFTRDRSNSAVNPSRGTVARLELRHASRAIFSDQSLQFNKGLGDGSWYVTAGHGNVLALRLRVGAVLGKQLSLRDNGPTFIPPEERLFAGGSTTVRGFRQNELGPLLYLARAVDTTRIDSTTQIWVASSSAGYERAVPSGGNSLVVANAEYRLRSPFLAELLQWTVFTDAGAVWDR